MDLYPSLPLLRIDVATRSDLDPPVARIPGAAQDAGKVVLVHQVAVVCPALFLHLLGVFLLVLGEDQLAPPSVLAPSFDVGSLAI